MGSALHDTANLDLIIGLVFWGFLAMLAFGAWWWGLRR